MTATNGRISNTSALQVYGGAFERAAVYGEPETMLAPVNRKPMQTLELAAHVIPAPGERCGCCDQIVPEYGGAHGLNIDRELVLVTVYGVPINATPIEYRMVATLLAHLGRVVPIKTFTEAVWGQNYVDGISRVSYAHLARVNLARLRRKFKEAGLPAHEVIITRPWVGYMISRPGVQSKPLNARQVKAILDLVGIDRLGATLPEGVAVPMLSAPSNWKAQP